jgi:FMN-dependent NADH-azoreductase
MTNILKIDTSLRSGISGTHPHGSLSRRLTELFIQQWNEIDSSIDVKYRDLGQNPYLILMKNGFISEFGYAESEEKHNNA